MTVSLVNQHSIYQLALLAARSTTFRDLVGVNSEQDAMRHILFPAADYEEYGWTEDDVDPRIHEKELHPPRILIADDDFSDWVWEKSSTSQFNWHRTYHVTFDFLVPADEAVEGIGNAYTWYVHKVRTILSEMMNVSISRQEGVAGSGIAVFNCTMVQKVSGPMEVNMGEWLGEKDFEPDCEWWTSRFEFTGM